MKTVTCPDRSVGNRLPSAFVLIVLMFSLFTAAAQDNQSPPNLIYIINPTKPEALKVTTGGVISAPNGRLYVFSSDKRAVVAAGDKSEIDVGGMGMLGGSEVTMGAKTSAKRGG